MSYWGRHCKACDVLTGDVDPSWPNCWYCGADLSAVKEYNEKDKFGRSPSMYQGALIIEVLEKEPAT